MRPSPLSLLPSSSSSLLSSSSSTVPISQFGRYHVLYPSRFTLPPSSFPAPHPVPSSIAIPHYVPPNFWSLHSSSSNAQPIVPSPEPNPKGGKIVFGGKEEKGVREAAKLASEVLKEAGRLVKPGVTTAEIDRLLHEMIVGRGAYPSPLGYSKFPKSVCTSINNVIAHGIPDDRPLDPTDLINIDVTVFLNGYHGDTSRTFLLPEADEEAIELCEVTEEALEAAIRICGPGVPFNEIGRVIEEVTDRYGYIVSDLFSGHGISTVFHHPPWILHCLQPSSTNAASIGLPDGREVMEAGDCFTIEPSVEQVSETAGMGEMWEDKWTVVTKSGSRSAQFEHQLLIGEDGVEVLTR
ncbi:peptidase M24, structural domain-containing protein [Mrakia frigida]|uniref:methionyl aminopeptidase n=1 Tax=Mrakia frigida TaxID=29902 RepID=UPI003FCBFD82